MLSSCLESALRYFDLPYKRNHYKEKVIYLIERKEKESRKS